MQDDVFLFANYPNINDRNEAAITIIITTPRLIRKLRVLTRRHRLRFALRSINFTFRCHRSAPDNNKSTNVYAVNDVQFHPVHTTTFVTAGSDGTFHFWDRISHTRYKAYEPPATLSTTAATTLSKSPTWGTAKGARRSPDDGSPRAAITTTAFNCDGSLFAYAVGYDWSKGHAANTPNYPNRLVLHSVTDEDVKPRRKT